MLERRTLQIVEDVPSQITPLFWFRLALILIANACTILSFGWREPLFDPTVLLYITGGAIGLDLFLTIAAMARASGADGRRRALASAGAFAAVVEALTLLTSIPVDWALPIGAAIVAGIRLLRVYLWIVRAKLPPPLILVTSFAILIFSGTAALLLPASTPPDESITVVDALFTSTSAVCVTGLAVRDTGTEFTRLGQVIILALMQLGGLGIVVFGAIFAVLFGRSIGLRASQTVAGLAGEAFATPRTLRRLVIFIACATFATEIVGAAFLFIGWPHADGWRSPPPNFHEPGERAFHAVFYAVSAFNNAGFATAPESLRGLHRHWTTHLVIPTLVFLGGIGFPVLNDLRRVALARLRGQRVEDGKLIRLSLHSKIVLATTAILYLIGFGGILTSELVQSAHSPADAVLDAHFMSVTSRTAGFDTIPPSDLGPLARFLMTVLMFIGGSPGSTAGGAKTVAVAVLVLTIWATINGRTSPRAFKRQLPEEMVRKAATFVSLQFCLTAFITALLTITESGRTTYTFEPLLFEAVSACATAGLSLGVTPALSDEGRVVLVFGMFLGRVGPLAALVALVAVARDTKVRYTYPTEGVLIN